MAKLRLTVMVFASCCIVPDSTAQDPPVPSSTARNSTAKLRKPPSPQAARAGAAVEWRKDLATALADAKASHKPVFWYVPTVPGSPMDRRPELDRVMMSGPFSWPETIAILNERFVPLRATPVRDDAKARALVRGKFIEPGFLVLGEDGVEVSRCDRITTLAPDWWRARLGEALGESLPCRLSARVQDALAAYAQGEPAAAEGLLRGVIERGAIEGSGAEGADGSVARFLLGVVLRRQRQFEAADAVWDALVAATPEHPLAAKIAAEREGHGPFLRGIEDWKPLPAAVLAGARTSTQAASGAFTREAMIKRSLQFLVDQQEEDGGYRDSIYDFGGTDSLPNVHMAITSLVGWALLEHRDSLVGELRTAVDAALARIDGLIRDETRIASEDRDEIAWAHAYRLRVLCRWMDGGDEARSRSLTKAQELVGALAGLQEESGAWFHEYSNPFVLATVLLALHHAKVKGLEVPDDAITRGVRALQQCRAQNGGFPSGMARLSARRIDLAGAAGRMPLCELALLRFRASDQERLGAALTAAFEHHHRLEAIRKYDDHADSLGYGGFFFWYDVRARREAIAAITDDAARARWQAQQDAIVLALPEIDGCFVDSHELGRCYGTAMALLCLTPAQ